MNKNKIKGFEWVDWPVSAGLRVVLAAGGTGRPVALLGQSQTQTLLLQQIVVESALEGGVQPPESALAGLVFGARDFDETFVQR